MLQQQKQYPLRGPQPLASCILRGLYLRNAVRLFENYDSYVPVVLMTMIDIISPRSRRATVRLSEQRMIRKHPGTGDKTNQNIREREREIRNEALRCLVCLETVAPLRYLPTKPHTIFVCFIGVLWPCANAYHRGERAVLCHHVHVGHEKCNELLEADLMFVGICGPEGKHGRCCGQGAMQRVVVGTLVVLHRFHSTILQLNVKNSDELGNPFVSCWHL